MFYHARAASPAAALVPMPALTLALSMALVLALAAGPWAQTAALEPETPVEAPLVIEAVGATKVASILSALGYETQVAREKGGDPVILAAVGPRPQEEADAESGAENDPAVGLRFAVLFYGCRDAAAAGQAERLCDSLVLHASFAMIGDAQTIRDINEWDRMTRYSRAFLDQQGHPVLERDIVLDGGVTAKWLGARLGEWRRGLAGFAERLNYTPPNSGKPTVDTENGPEPAPD